MCTGLELAQMGNNERPNIKQKLAIIDNNERSYIWFEAKIMGNNERRYKSYIIELNCTVHIHRITIINTRTPYCIITRWQTQT